MAPPKRSRKGKKAWRQNIDTTEEHEALEAHTLKERQGPGVDTLQDSELFFIDTAGAPSTAAPTQQVQLKRKREKKPLRCQLVIQAAHNAQPVPLPPPRRKKQSVTQPSKKNSAVPSAKPKDKQQEESDPRVTDVWGDAANTSELEGGAQGKSKKQRRAIPATASLIPAVEVDLAGCSYNPDPEQRQDAVALLVAGEMKKILQKEMEPKAPPSQIEAVPHGTELDLLLVDAEADDDPEQGKEGGEVVASLPESAGLGDEVQNSSLATAIAKAQDRKTKKERNRAKRKKLIEHEEQQRKALKKQRAELSRLAQLESEIKEQEQQQQLKLQRREVVKAEKAASQPPRLGKHKFEAEPVQVLLSDELTGSLRTITPSFTLLRDRFKSLQKRGIVEPRKPVGARKAGRKVEYETGGRTEKAVALKQEVEALRAARKKRKAQ